MSSHGQRSRGAGWWDLSETGRHGRWHGGARGAFGADALATSDLSRRAVVAVARSRIKAPASVLCRVVIVAIAIG